MNSYKNAEEALRKAGREYRMRPKRTFYPFFDKFDPVVAIATLAMVVIAAALAVLL